MLGSRQDIEPQFIQGHGRHKFLRVGFTLGKRLKRLVGRFKMKWNQKEAR